MTIHYIIYYGNTAKAVKVHGKQAKAVADAIREHGHSVEVREYPDLGIRIDEIVQKDVKGRILDAMNADLADARDM